MTEATRILNEQPEQALGRFTERRETDCARRGDAQGLDQWLFIDRKLSRGELVDLNFYGFYGHDHVLKFFQWIQGPPYHDYFGDFPKASLVEASVRRDGDVFKQLGVGVNPAILEKVGLYNAQDYLCQRLYPVPERQKVRRILDFGAGHGRMANLAFGAEGSDIQLMVSVDSIPSSYLTQRLYYSALGCKLADYIDDPDLESNFVRVADQHEVVHIPTWRMDILPDNYFDMVCCVQVLREVPQALVFQMIREFQRVLRPGGALYIRDSNEMHNPNQLPQDLIVSSSGFLLEFYPRVANLADIHGIPRIWRKLDPAIFLTA